MRAVFPGGTITGAPKVRTMEIIEELEPTRRGLYTGSIGWFGFNQDMHFNIVIRTAYCTGAEPSCSQVQALSSILYQSTNTKNRLKSLCSEKSITVEQRRDYFELEVSRV